MNLTPRGETALVVVGAVLVVAFFAAWIAWLLVAGWAVL